ncbi:sugar phosphate isomerase/epimerase family protein [Microlunatus soli]|uniref:Sugar phosphate isomerase/epimerase n=1 Tax=Microlunatus soli TaxID=630515 RepID=A0A1H1TAI0_9ACTN|nr:sugar phosphate isomerase/epimerase family protein [Microlunatus soli]SDS57138.1 Sugar phosphate isomerase/epimerase [Microlunatus soli]
MFKIGFSTLGCPGYSVEQVAALARDNGFDGVEIRFIRGVVDLATLEEFSAGRIADTAKIFADAGVEVSCIDTSVRFGSGDPDELATQREIAKINCEIAGALGARYIRVFGGTRPADADPDTSLQTIADGLGTVADDAHAAGIEALLETHDDFCTAATVQPLLDRTSDRLGVLWDFMHSFRNGESAEQTWSALGPRIRQVHVKDGSVATPEKFDLVLTGTGIVPLGDAIRVLRAADFTGYVDFEWEKAWHPEIEPPEVAIPHFRQALQTLISGQEN